jgi:hypothetical protein
VAEDQQIFKDGQWDGVFAALVGFYFGARS